MATPFNEVKAVWLRSRVGGNVGSPLAQLERDYYISELGYDAPLAQLRIDWLRFAIADNGGTPQGTKQSDLWKQLLVTLSLPVSTITEQNKNTFYRLAAI